MHLSSPDGVYAVNKINDGITLLLMEYGVAHVRECIQGVMINLNEQQLQQFDADKAMQYEVLKRIDKAIVDAREQ